MHPGTDSFRRNAGLLLAATLLAALAGCSQERWSYVALQGASVALPPMTERPTRAERGGMPAEMLEIRPGGQMLLIAHEASDEPGIPDRQWGRSFVVVLEGAPAKGTVQVSPDNGRLVEHEFYRPARRPYVGLEGRVEIMSIEGGEVTAYCALRSLIRYADDRAFVLRGVYKFKPATMGEPFLHGRNSGLMFAGRPGE